MHGRMFGRMNNRVLVVNELSAAGNQVASFMKSQRAFSASFPNFLFFTLTSLCALFPENPLTVLILDSIPIYLNTFLLCELVSHVYGHHCIPQVLPVLNLNQTQTHTHSDISKHHFKTPRPYLFPSVPPYIWADQLKESMAWRKKDKFIKKYFQLHTKGFLHGSLESSNYQINVHFKFKYCFIFQIHTWLFVAHKKPTMLCLAIWLIWHLISFFFLNYFPSVQLYCMSCV